MQSSNRIPMLDGIRAVAILLVLTGHSLAGLSGTSWTLPALLFGETGVSLFFVLSGYLITGRMLANENTNGSLQLRRFYRNRALRILPAFLALLISLAVLAKLGLIPAPDRITWLASVFCFRNMRGSGWETAHLWTLALEEQFYLLWPAFFVLCRRRRLTLIALLIAAFTVHRALWLQGHPLSVTGPGSYRCRPDCRLDTFLIGCGFALGRTSRIWWPLPPLSVAAFIFWNIFNVGFAWTRPFDTPVSAALLGLLIVAAVQLKGGPLLALLSSRPAAVLGTLSYSMYLWQQIFLGRQLHWWNFPAVALIACASYWLIERPFLRLKDRRKTEAVSQPAATLFHPDGSGVRIQFEP